MSLMVSQMLERQRQQLRKQQQVEEAHVADEHWYQFLVAPHCPPNKKLHIRGGIASPSKTYGFILNQDYIQDVTCDFEDVDETQLTLNFTNANYYLPILLCYKGDWIVYGYSDPEDYGEPIFDCVDGYEVATAREAEAQIDGWLNGVDQWYDYRLPLWGIVLRNDGLVGVDCAILPIDAVNRSRSYLYRDARSRTGIFP